MIQKLISFYTEPRVPYFISSRFVKIALICSYCFHFFLNKFLYKHKKIAPTIAVRFGFHGQTGGSVAGTTIVNILAEYFNVVFITFPLSFSNRMLNYKINFSKNLFPDADLYLLDAELDINYYRELKHLGKPTILTCHCFPDRSHGLSPEHIIKAVNSADFVQFVSQVQEEEFKLSKNKTTVIPNSNVKIMKLKNGNNVGIIGNYKSPIKHVRNAIGIALQSKAELVNVWSVDNFFYDNKRVVRYPWSNNKSKIFDNIDVLLSMSSCETFGMIVIEAMSAGVPCVLADIPAFRAFQDCPGISVVNRDATRIHEIINDALMNKLNFKENMIKYWKDHYSKDIIGQKWVELVNHLIEKHPEK